MTERGLTPEEIRQANLEYLLRIMPFLRIFYPEIEIEPEACS